MLRGSLRAIVNKPFYGKYKKLIEKLIALSFSHKMFQKIIPKLMPLRHSLTFPFKFLAINQSKKNIYIYCNKYACLIFALINLSYINKYA